MVEGIVLMKEWNEFQVFYLLLSLTWKKYLGSTLRGSGAVAIIR